MVVSMSKKTMRGDVDDPDLMLDGSAKQENELPQDKGSRLGLPRMIPSSINEEEEVERSYVSTAWLAKRPSMMD